jgi:hypothetical protein
MTKDNKKAPVSFAELTGGVAQSSSTGHTQHTPAPSVSKEAMLVYIAPDGPTISIPAGRDAETLRLLIICGQRGFTSGEASKLRWARRTSAYIHRLRGYGIDIETIREKTKDGASIARYRLVVDVMVLDCGLADGEPK